MFIRHIDCICNVKDSHDSDCKFRRAIQCPVAIECDHGYDVCPVCDPCTCHTKEETK